jgi:octaprenyl-diphosphate synthase
VDDVLDLTATEEVLGKPVASDLREGKATLAVIHSIDHGTRRPPDHSAGSGRPQL